MIAAGGLITADDEQSANRVCEAYDVDNDQWYCLSPMTKARHSTSMVKVNDRFIFIFNGLVNETSLDHAIEFLDVGNCSITSMKNAKWKPVNIVTDDTSIRIDRIGNLALAYQDNYSILIGGGFVYSVDASMISMKHLPPEVVSPRILAVRDKFKNEVMMIKQDWMKLPKRVEFGSGNDMPAKLVYGRTGKKIIAVDSDNKQMYTYTFKRKKWETESLANIGFGGNSSIEISDY